MPQEQAGGGLGYELMVAAQAWRSGLTEAIRDTGLTAPQFFALATVLRAGNVDSPLTQAELASRAALDVNVASQVLRTLESRGLIVREQHPGDSRARSIRLTADGTALTRRAATLARRHNERFFRNADQASLAAQLALLSSESNS
jgi:DNA-binding MarR family transcriptional regulator